MSKFKWIDYETFSALFVEGLPGNIALLNQKSYKLKINTGATVFIKADDLDEAKSKAEHSAVKLYKEQYETISKILPYI